MRIFLVKSVEKFVRQERIANAALVKAVADAEQGSIAADLGAGVIKQRVARHGQGKSGGYRTILAFRIKDRAVFMYGFAKNERDNIGPKELEAFKAAADGWLKATDLQINALKERKALFEIEVENGPST
ncbi:hypothetical protein MMA231_01609 [Asticcacaulis sp. MM231]|uniref:type II toxin-antitoxin system RelE/ParE family toxin n=1 Tax=Asticcacaulis sp. MM231 TaxID=3157666 RepID=UPI0032D58571